MFSQKLEVSGIAKTSTDFGNVMITLNDTLRKLPPNYPKALYHQMWEDKDVITFSEYDGNFAINALATDSLIFSRERFVSQRHSVADLLAKNDMEISLEKEPCVEYIACKELRPQTYIFIASKIEIKSAAHINYCNRYSMDSKSQATYKILENFSKFEGDTITFASYDHFSIVNYDEYENIILYVAKYCDSLVQVKYKFRSVYTAKDGRWVSPVLEEYASRKMQSLKQPHKVNVSEPIVVPGYLQNKDLKAEYPEPYYRVRKGKVFMKYGYYAQDLIDF